MKYIVTAKNWELNEEITIGTYDSPTDAEIAIEEALEDDYTYGEADLYSYYINGKEVA